MLAGLPPMAVPMTVKMPEPITAPMPSAVSEPVRRGPLTKSQYPSIARPDKTKGGAQAPPFAVILSQLPLRLAACRLLDLGLIFAARAGARSLRSGLLAGGPLHCLALGLVGNRFRVCHECLSSL